MKKHKIIISWSLVAACMTIIFCFSAQKANESLSTSGGFAETLAELLYNDSNQGDKAEIIRNCQFIVRKTAHFSIYALLGILSYFACKFSGFRIYPVIAAAVSLLYAISDEIHQYFVEGRSCEIRDMAIDFSGAVTGILTVSFLLLIISKIRKEK